MLFSTTQSVKTLVMLQGRDMMLRMVVIHGGCAASYRLSSLSLI